MAGLDVNQTVKQLTEVGNKLSNPPSSVTALLSLLDETEVLFSHIRQSPSEQVKEALKISQKALIADELFRHSDPNVRVTVAACLNEVMRISAPTPPYKDEKMIEIFELLVSTFENLSCEPGCCYAKGVSILHSVAKLRSCVMMLDLDCDWLVIKMLELFQKNVSPKHPQSVLLAMVKIMTVMIEESEPVSLELLKILLESVKMENQSVSPASWELGDRILEGCSNKLKPFIMEIVSSSGFSLEDYAPILSSICKPENDIATNETNDSPTMVNNESAETQNHSSEFVQGLSAKASKTRSKASGNGGSSSKRGKKQNSENLDKEKDDKTNKNNGSPKKDVVLKKVKEEVEEFEDNSIGKSRPPKRDVKALRKKNDVAGTSGSSGKKVIRQTKETFSGSGNKSKTGQSRKDKPQMNDSSKNLRKRAASSDDDVFETPHGRKYYKEDLVGSRIKVWWPLDRRYYEGSITSYEASGRKHRVDYDDGDEEVLNLRKEIWEFLGDETPDLASLFEKQTPPQPPLVTSQDEPPAKEEITPINNEKEENTLINNDKEKEEENTPVNNDEKKEEENTPINNDEMKEEENTPINNDEKMEEVEPCDASDDANTTEEKSEIAETKRRKLSDNNDQNS